MKVVLNQCYCDSFDISEKAKQCLRQYYGIIFDPVLTPRDDPALIRVIEVLGEEAAIFHDDQGERVYYAKPIVVIVARDQRFEIQCNYGFETIRYVPKRSRSEHNMFDSPRKTAKI